MNDNQFEPNELPCRIAMYNRTEEDDVCMSEHNQALVHEGIQYGHSAAIHSTSE